MGYYKFTLTLSSDSGKFRIRTVAASEQLARQAVMAVEHCPAGAILSVRQGARVA
jgi:ferredoxin